MAEVGFEAPFSLLPGIFLESFLKEGESKGNGSLQGKEDEK